MQMPALRTTSMERSWLTRLGLSLNARTVTGVRAYRRSVPSLASPGKPGVQVVGLRIYSTPKLAPSLTPVLILAVARPADFLRHQLKSVLPYLTTGQEGQRLLPAHRRRAGKNVS